jgi:tetratricopeptide (TPR) repeat protein
MVLNLPVDETGDVAPLCHPSARKCELATSGRPPLGRDREKTVSERAAICRCAVTYARAIVECLVLLWVTCQQASASLDFVQITDPHLFGGVTENEQALMACIQNINAYNKNKAYRFVILTGDIGIEDLVSTRNNTPDKKRELKPNPDEERKKGAKQFADIVAKSDVKKWLFIPGNNDLIDETPDTIDHYNGFIADVSEFLRDRGIEAINLTADSDSNACIVDKRYAFIGFNNASFKSNNLALNAKSWRDSQMAEIAKVDSRRREILANNQAEFAYILYHIPEVDDPYYVLDVLPTTEAVDKFISERAKGRLDTWINNRDVSQSKLKYSAWTVKSEVWDAWNRLVAQESVKGLFAGHFHDWRQSTYRNLQWLVTKDYPKATLDKLHICPPVAIKNQIETPDEARGFCEVSIADDGMVTTHIVWYRPRMFEWESDQGLQPMPPVIQQTVTASADLAPRTESSILNLSVSGVEFALGFLLALAGVVAINYGVWRHLQSKVGADADSTRRATVVIAIWFLCGVMLGFVVLASLAASQGTQTIRVVSVGGLWALAATAVGAALGFLFGVPRANVPTSVRPASGPAVEFATENQLPVAKTNLEEIADWLSKLIVGGTLFESSNVLKLLQDAGQEFAKTVGGETALWSGVGSSSLVYFGLVAFFGGHFLTRLYLIGALRHADEGDRPIVAARTGLTDAQVGALDAAPLNIVTAGAEFDPIAQEAAEKIVKLPMESLTNWRDVRLWAKAQLSGKDTDAAIKAYQKVIEIVPNDAETRLGYAVALMKRKSAIGLILNQLEAARASLMVSSPMDLRKNVYKSLTYVCLKLKKPESFRKALEYAREYLTQPQAVQSGSLLINIACAYAQCYEWLQQDKRRKVNELEITVTASPPPDLLKEDKRGELLEWIEQQALTAMKGAISRDEAAKKMDDDDLKVFRDRPLFRDVVGASEPTPAPTGSPPST